MYHYYRTNAAVLTYIKRILGSKIIYLQELRDFSCDLQKNRKLIIFFAGSAKKEFHQAGFSQTNLYIFLALAILFIKS